MAATSSAPESAWVLIDAERRRDRLLRRISIGAWSVTLLVVLIFILAVGTQIWQMMKELQVGAIATTMVVHAAMPLIWGLGLVSLLIATLSTIGVFLRLRAASLAEIQVRLAALEELVLTRTQRDG
jgi:hypothetical protein